MFVLLGALSLFVTLGLLTRRFGALQHVTVLAIAVTMAALYLFVEGTY